MKVDRMENRSELRDVIIETLSEIVDEQGIGTLELNEESVLLESGVDSLGFAILVSRLEDRLGVDPFSVSDEPYYPKTLGEFVSFYQKYAA